MWDHEYASPQLHKISNKLGEAVEKVAKASMIQASVEVKENEITNIGISYDGTWQKRGYSSFTTGKVLDCEVLSGHCKSCTIHYPLRESKPAEYETWLVSHKEVCQLNHQGSATSMESAAAVTIFS